MSTEKYLAAIEISSSKIIAAVGKTTGNGSLDVVAIEQEKITDFVRYGIIQNAVEVATQVARLIDRLEHNHNVVPRKIDRLIIGLSGRSMRSIPTTVKRPLPEDTEITREIISRLHTEAANSSVDSSIEIIDSLPRDYRVDKRSTISPIGERGNSIEATYDLIVSRPQLKKNIIRTIVEKLGLESAGFVATPMAVGHLILSSDQKQLGCMLVDVGAETTTVTIYKDGTLRYFSTIPLGSRHITRDLMALGSLLEVRAEEIKTQQGKAIISEDIQPINIQGVKNTDVLNFIVARAEEITANINEQIAYAGLKDSDLGAGIVYIGGGMRLTDFPQLLSRRIGLDVRAGSLPSYVKISDSKASSLECIQVISVLYAGATMGCEECLSVPERAGIPITGTPNPDEEPDSEKETKTDTIRKPGLFETFKSSLASMFGGGADDDDDDDPEI